MITKGKKANGRHFKFFKVKISEIFYCVAILNFWPIMWHAEQNKYLLFKQIDLTDMKQ